MKQREKDLNPDKKLPFGIDPVNALVAFGVWLLALVVYLLTVAPTLSFWDCGEFIACSTVLGIPHPPGNPLYIMLGRLFAIIPFSSDPAVRVNMLSVIPSTFTALFGYLAAVRILRTWLTDNSRFSTFLTYAGSAAGALFLAFSLTNWNNAVETEVYGLSLMIMAAILWLTLIYAEHREHRYANRLLLLLVYLSFLGIGVHLTTFLIFPVVALLLVVRKDAPTRVWFIFATAFVFEFYLIFAFSSRPGEIPYYFPVLIALLIYLFYIFSFERIPRIYVWGSLPFLLAAAPMASTTYRSIGQYQGKQFALNSGWMQVFQVAGTVGLVALGVAAAFAFFRHRSAGGKAEHNREYFMLGLFSAAALVLVGFLFFPKGYVPFLIVSAMVGLVVVGLTWRYLCWPLLIALGAVAMVAVAVKPFIYGTVAAAVILSIVGLVFKQRGWKTALMVLMVAMVGFSTHLFIPLRSASDPAINENNPSQSLAATINYIERKQYMTQPMIERMFKRRAEWVNQFGDYRRMGFWRFFNEDYGLSGPRFILLFLLGIFGVWEMIRRRPRIGLPFLLLLLISSIGLVLYMNFADGTRQHPVTGADYIEVRDRGYFFTPVFVFFSLAIGIGITVTIQFVREAASRLKKPLLYLATGVASLLYLLPIYALAGNYHQADRADNYIPYDYAWNLLISVDPNGVLFTNGDNDTFPLWCLQEVYGIRKDVRVVNLSLANTKWYIKQLKSKMGLELGWTDDEIDRLRAFRTPDGTVYRVPDQVINAIIENNYGKVPVSFSITVSTSARRYAGHQIDTLLSQHGLMLRFNSSPPKSRIHLDDTYDFYMNPDKFACRGVSDPNVFQDETTARLTRNWASGFLILADALLRADDTARALLITERAVEAIPQSIDAANYLTALYSDAGNEEGLLKVLHERTDLDSLRIITLIGRARRLNGDTASAERTLLDVLAENPGYRPAFDELMRLYVATRQAVPIQSLVVNWLKANPNDKRVKAIWEDMVRSRRPLPENQKN